jgi:hypothetical protein
MSKRVATLLLSFWIAACGSIGPGTVSRDRVDYVNAIGNSWERKTLLNIVKLRYGHAPIFFSVTQVVTGYQFQSTVNGGLAASSFTAVADVFGLTGTAAAEGQYTDRPTIIYTPLTGVDFLQKLMKPIPPSAALFLLQSGYDASTVMPLTLESINGINNQSRLMHHVVDPRFERVAQLIRELQLAEAFQVRIEHPKKDAETSLITFSPTPQAEAQAQALRRLLGLRPGLERFHVYYGGYSGRDDQISMARSVLQVMLELAAGVDVPESDVAAGKAFPGTVEGQAVGTRAVPAVSVLSGNRAPPDAATAIQYAGRWFWISETDIRSKSIFATVMFSISDFGAKGPETIVNVPAQG